MVKVTIVFHSVCGNTYLIGKSLYESFKEKGIEPVFRRVKDEDAEELVSEFPIIKEYIKDILDVPICKIEDLTDSDYIFLGSPTYFGNVSSEMKAFMDSFAPIWSEAKLYGKKLVAFTTHGSAEGGAESCLKAINIFGQHLGMLPVPIPANILPGTSVSAYGISFHTGDMGDIRPNEECKKVIDNLTKIIIRKVI